MTESELRQTALSLQLKPSDVQSLQAPISSFGTSPTRQSIDIVDTKKLKELAEALQKDDVEGMWKGTGKVSLDVSSAHEKLVTSQPP